MVFGLFFVWCKKNSLEVQVDDLVKTGFHYVDYGLSIYYRDIFLLSKIWGLLPSLKLAANAPENGWLED